MANVGLHAYGVSQDWEHIAHAALLRCEGTSVLIPAGPVLPRCTGSIHIHVIHVHNTYSNVPIELRDPVLAVELGSASLAENQRRRRAFVALRKVALCPTPCALGSRESSALAVHQMCVLMKNKVGYSCRRVVDNDKR